MMIYDQNVIRASDHVSVPQSANQYFSQEAEAYHSHLTPLALLSYMTKIKQRSEESPFLNIVGCLEMFPHMNLL